MADWETAYITLSCQLGELERELAEVRHNNKCLHDELRSFLESMADISTYGDDQLRLVRDAAKQTLRRKYGAPL